MPDDPINLLFRRVKSMHRGAGTWPSTTTTALLVGQWFAELGYDIDGPSSQRAPVVRVRDGGWPVVDVVRAEQLADLA